MANITKRTNKDGKTTYRIRVFISEGIDGAQKVKSMTWTPPANMRASAAEKQAQKEAVLFEERLKLGLASYDGKTTFTEYATEWVKNEPLAFKTRERYTDLLRRIIPAIGHIRLEKLQAHHLEELYRNLAEPGVKDYGRFSISYKMKAFLKRRRLSIEGAARKVGVAASTMRSAVNGKRITIDKAIKICEGFNVEYKSLFKQYESTECLSPKTIHHHHQLICAILAKAKKERIVPYNVAAEHATAPKKPRKEAQYLDDEQARKFLGLFLQEKDIRVKTVFAVLLFTGVRRGELCGLSWTDIDADNQIIHIRRASQYQRGNGVVEVPTKNESSLRAIDVPAFVISILNEYKAYWSQHRLMWGKEWQGKDKRLFIQDNGKPINPDTINYWMEKFLKKHDFPHVTPHSLRHTFTTLQITAGVDIRTLQARTGHAQASTLVNTYSHAIKSAQEAASKALEGVLLPKAEAGATEI